MQVRVVPDEQVAADALALPVRAYTQVGEVVMRRAVRMPLVQELPE